LRLAGAGCIDLAAMPEAQKYFVHVFAGNFPTAAAACTYGQWDYSADEDNPIRAFSDEFDGLRFDEDYLEVLHGSVPFEYLRDSILEQGSDVETIRALVQPQDNTLVLLMELGDNRDIRIPHVTGKQVRYCGRFRALMRHE
jgi:hypothetical protein